MPPNTALLGTPASVLSSMRSCLRRAPVSSRSVGARASRGLRQLALRRLALLFLSVAVYGCTSIKVTYVDPSPRAATQPSAVEVFREEPTRSYRVVARFKFEDKGWQLTRDQLDRRVRVQAARLGGQAAVLDQNVQSHFVSEGLLVGHTSEVSQQVLFVRVIVFTEPATR